MSDDQQVTDGGDFHKYYTALPNLIDDFKFKSGWTHRVYAHLKRVTGAAPGSPFDRPTRQIAKHLGCSVGAVHNAKSELTEVGLIVVEKYDTPTGEGDLLHLLDIWPENAMVYSEVNKPKAKRRPLVERVEEAKQSIKARAAEWQAEFDAKRAEVLEARKRSNSERLPESERSNSERKDQGGSVQIVNAGVQIVNAQAGGSVHSLNDSEEHEKNHEKNHDHARANAARGGGKKKRGDQEERTAEEQSLVDLQQRILKTYMDGLGYTHDGDREARAARKLADKRYQPDQVMACYVAYKAKPAWFERHLSLETINTNIAAWEAALKETAGGPHDKAKTNGVAAGASRNGAGGTNGRAAVSRNGLAGGAMPADFVEQERARLVRLKQHKEREQSA